jgi:drug/metabolite transporter (DMT)-like permease
MKLADVFRVAKTYKMSDAQRFAQHVVPEVVRPARIIWNQAIGALFALFAVFFFGYAYNYYHETGADAKRAGSFGFMFLGVVMSFFAITSFMQARKIGRPRIPGKK